MDNPEYNNIKIELPEREPPVTIIVAMRENDDSVLIAADGESMESSLLRMKNNSKLGKHPAGLIAWGTSGNSAIGEVFSAWLQSYTWPPKDWFTFKEQAIEELSRLNGRQRELTKLSGAEVKDDYLCSCLLVGLIDSAGIYELDIVGRASPYWEVGFQAIGSGRLHAGVAYRTLCNVSGPTHLQKLIIIMQVVTQTAPGCGPPYTIWRITKDNITDVSSGEDKLKDKRNETTTKPSHKPPTTP
jgi:ATP-dependent protease HslVU (ClpYQ) peptidase subunit